MAYLDKYGDWYNNNGDRIDKYGGIISGHGYESFTEKPINEPMPSNIVELEKEVNRLRRELNNMCAKSGLEKEMMKRLEKEFDRERFISGERGVEITVLQNKIDELQKFTRFEGMDLE